MNDDINVKCSTMMKAQYNFSSLPDIGLLETFGTGDMGTLGTFQMYFTQTADIHSHDQIVIEISQMVYKT